jgi:hypothetical protein
MKRLSSTLVTRPGDVLADLEVRVAIKLRQFPEMFDVTGPHMEDDHLPVVGVRYIRSGDVVAEVGAVMPEE